MKIFVVHSSGMYGKALEYAKDLEAQGHETFVPLRDTKQVKTTEHAILESNRVGMIWCDEAHVLWDLSSLGVIFDLGMAYALDRPIKIIKVKTHHWTKFIARYEGEYIL